MLSDGLRELQTIHSPSTTSTCIVEYVNIGVYSGLHQVGKTPIVFSNVSVSFASILLE